MVCHYMTEEVEMDTYGGFPYWVNVKMHTYGGFSHKMYMGVG